MDQDGYFAEPVAASYDESSADMFESDVVAPAVDLLAELAGGGRALELGIGTGPFSLAYLVFNTIMNLTTQEAQVACFRNVAAHLPPEAAS